MTVRELINILKIYNPEAEVKFSAYMTDETVASFVWDECNAFYDDEDFTLDFYVYLKEGTDDAN